jgi:hypothetical protein
MELEGGRSYVFGAECITSTKPFYMMDGKDSGVF